METATASRQFLKDLCCNFGWWDYAIFWKLRHQIPAVLSWEDGYSNRTSPGTPLEMLCFDGSSQYPVDHLVADLSCLQHKLGQGFVGKVAFTDNSSWISTEDVSARQFEHDKPLGFSEEWLPHLLAGIKTVLLVSVHPHGVLELGSSEKVVEDPRLVDLIKERFIAHQDRHLLHSSQSFDDMDEPTFITGAVVDKLLREESPEDSDEGTDSIFGPLQGILDDLEENKDLILSAIGLFDEPLGSSQPNMGQGEQFSVSYIGEDEEDAEDIGYENLGSMFSVPMDCDLFEALGWSFQGQTSEFPALEASFREIRDLPDTVDLFSIPNEAWDLGEYETKVKPEDLLEAVIGNFGDDHPDATSPNSSETQTSSTAPVVQCDPVPSSKSPKKSDGTFNGGGDDSVLWNNTEAGFATRTGNSSSKHSSPSSSKSTVSCVVDKEQPKLGQKHQLSGNTRKARSGESQRPRPRDRQLIQDRVKELRELVPNSDKCSIDALLDRTVKHMNFLRSVTNQADKLRKCMPPKETRPKIWKSLGIDEEDCEKRRGWAFDFGSEFQVFPIVVEDLEYPGQMLIEMVCDEQGLFLEIARVIRRLELTILKGVMETRSDNTWARFVVEASKGFQRTEIFWPLMQVLQQRGKPEAGTA